MLSEDAVVGGVHNSCAAVGHVAVVVPSSKILRSFVNSGEFNHRIDIALPMEE